MSRHRSFAVTPAVSHVLINKTQQLQAWILFILNNAVLNPFLSTKLFYSCNIFFFLVLN